MPPPPPPTSSPPEPHLLTADAILPMDPAYPPVLFDAGIIITNDRITALGQRSALRQQFGELPTTHHPGILLPGLINSHTHLELSYQKRIPPQPHFTHWVSTLIANYPPADQLETTITQAVHTGVTQSLRHGITTLGDISRHCTLTRSILATLPIRTISYGEIVALGKTRDKLIERLNNAATLPPTPPHLVTLPPCHLVTGLSPHAPYTVETPALEAIIHRAIRNQLPLAMHLAELPEESQFLRDQSGPLGREWDLMLKMDILDDKIPTFEGGPIRWAQHCGLLVNAPRPFPTLLAHVNYCDNTELALLATSQAHIAYCPRTHEYFRHPPHRYRDMLAAGINVTLATDSLASNPDLSVLKEAQLLHQRDHLDPLTALEMITRRPALALGLADHVGSLAPNKFADMMILPIPLPPDKNPNTLLKSIVSTAPQPTIIYIAGRPVPL